MESETHYKRVGLFLIVSTILTVLILVWFSRIFANDGRQKYIIFFERQTLDGLQKDSIVTMKGIKIGTVENYHILEENIQRVKVLIAVDKEVPVKTNTNAVIKRNLLTGLAKIDLVGGTKDAPSLESKFKDGIPVIPEGLADFAKIADSVPSVLDKVENAISRINKVLSDDNIENFGLAVEGLGNLASEVSTLTPSIKTSIKNFEAISTQSRVFAEKHLNDSSPESFSSRLENTMKNLEVISEQLKLATKDAESITKSTSRSIISMQESLKTISNNFQSIADSYGNPNLLLNKKSSEGR